MKQQRFAIMTEKINVNGQDVWIIITAHLTHMSDVESKEYFTASYHPIDPAIDPDGDTFLDKEHHPLSFASPEEALAYAREKLLAAY
ncbi:MAG: hypothetical protein QM726_12850 [Chitinophagaceae bacterium]